MPAEVTIRLLQKAIQESGHEKFLIDGFPRNEENRASFESIVRFSNSSYHILYISIRLMHVKPSSFWYVFVQTGIMPEIVLFFDCSEEEMEKRLLNRNQVGQK